MSLQNAVFPPSVTLIQANWDADLVCSVTLIKPYVNVILISSALGGMQILNLGER